jgi:hypothetical protein
MGARPTPLFCKLDSIDTTRGNLSPLIAPRMPTAEAAAHILSWCVRRFRVRVPGSLTLAKFVVLSCPARSSRPSGLMSTGNSRAALVIGNGLLFVTEMCPTMMSVMTIT